MFDTENNDADIKRVLAWQEGAAHHEDRAELDHHCKHAAGVLVTEQILADKEMGGGGDREELGEPLDHTQQGGFRERDDIQNYGGPKRDSILARRRT